LSPGLSLPLCQVLYRRHCLSLAITNPQLCPSDHTMAHDYITASFPSLSSVGSALFKHFISFYRDLMM
jgi:hypothetical protein